MGQNILKNFINVDDSSEAAFDLLCASSMQPVRDAAKLSLFLFKSRV